MKLELELIIKDSGVGIAKEEMTKIQEAFDQLSNEAKNKVEIGLGLTICHRLVRKMGGKLQVESSLHEGTMFTMTIATWCMMPKEAIIAYRANI